MDFQSDASFALRHYTLHEARRENCEFGIKIASIMQPRLLEKVNVHALKFKIKEVWFDSVCKTVESEFYCEKCLLLLLDEQQVLLHMRTKHPKHVRRGTINSELDESDKEIVRTIRKSIKEGRFREYMETHKQRFIDASQITITTSSTRHGDHEARL